jgi:hypothetical protein
MLIKKFYKQNFMYYILIIGQKVSTETILATFI